jgi:hypothetical protein
MGKVALLANGYAMRLTTFCQTKEHTAMADLTENGEHRVRIALVQKPADSDEQAARFVFLRSA